MTNFVADTTLDTLGDNEKLDKLRLARSENFGPVTYRQLIARYSSAGMALEAIPKLAQRGGRRRALKLFGHSAAVAETENVTALGGAHLHWGEEAYPKALAATEDAPPVLTVIGDKRLLSKRKVAIVCARNASINGRKIASKIAAGLSEEALTVVSGLARGIDAAAHDAAIEGGTIAVVAGGVDVIYPKEYTELYEQICARGAIVSEMPPGAEPRGPLFPQTQPDHLRSLHRGCRHQSSLALRLTHHRKACRRTGSGCLRCSWFAP